MKKHLMVALLACFIAGPVGYSFADDDAHKDRDKSTKKDGQKHDDDKRSEDIRFEDLPEKVAAAFRKEFPDAKVDDVDKKTHKGKVIYEIEFEDRDGKEFEVKMNPEGEIISQKED